MIRMWNPFNTIRYFGIYSLLMGITLLAIPQYVLPFFKIPIDDNESWLRLLGFVLCCSSYYYIRMSAKSNLDFARLTVHTRLLAPAIVVILILSGKADWHFLSFGIVDGLGGLWTLIAIRRAFKQSF
jgi:hypothetical protein